MGRYIKKIEVEKFQDILDRTHNALIISHLNPDGDAVGSSMAMYNYLDGLGINCSVVLPSSYPDYLGFLDNKNPIKIFTKDSKAILDIINSADLVIALDFNQLKRVDELETHIANSSATKVLIDHHPFPVRESFDLVISNTEVSSTCELLFWLFNLMQETEKEVVESSNVLLDCGVRFNLSLDIAEPLYVGMMTDTNNFANSVSSDTLLMASRLIDLGVDKEKLQNLVFGGFSENRMRLMGHMLLNRMVVLEKYNAGFILFSKEDQERFNYNVGDSEGFVNLPLNIQGVFLSALFTEKEGEIRVSLRSTNDFSVNKFSKLHFNGGGHERAAGGRLNIKFDEVADYFEKALEQSYQNCICDNLCKDNLKSE